MAIWRRLTRSRWDSSDPERAPPPLPLNPQSPSLTSRVGTSSAIQNAHAALSERVRESCPSPTKNPADAKEKPSVVRTSSHRRYLSLQPGTVRDLGSIIEGGANNSNSSRPSTPASSTASNDPRSPTKDFGTSAVVSGPSLTPIVRPTARRANTQSILAENTPPPSSTVLALQKMSSDGGLREAAALDAAQPLKDVTNNQIKAAQTLDNVSSQIAALTTIATTLQKEIAALSRRSRDNATDLLSLKKATNLRDEDIRKSLRDLVGQVTDQNQRLSVRETIHGLLIDNKPHNRSASPESDDTPSLDGGDNAATMALLEEILKGLGTREGEASLVKLLSKLSQQVSGMATANKVDELASFVQAQQVSNALVPVTFAERGRALSFDDSASNAGGLPISRSGPMTQRVERILNNVEARKNGGITNTNTARGADLVNQDMLNIIHSVKDSVAQGGGLTAEVKALVRELRGEVLGMGRELAKRLDEVERTQPDSQDALQRKDDVSRVIDQGLDQLKEQLNSVLREHRRTSASSTTSQKTVVDYQEIYNAMRAALRDNEASRDEMPDLSRDDVIQAVREAWEAYKPEVDVQHQGLERDEIMACLREGMEEFTPRDGPKEALSREEVYTAVVDGMQNYVPPQVDTAASLSRDEIIEAVRDCLEEFEFPVSAAAIGNDLTREHMVHAVKEGLSDLDVGRSRGLSVQDNEEIMTRLQDIMEYMKLEFRAVSEEAKDNVAATGRDTEQVLDATKDGLENLRIAIEGYVDRSAIAASGNDVVMEQLAEHFEEFKQEVARFMSETSDSNRGQLQAELEGIRDIVNTAIVPATPQATQGSHSEILEALQNGLTGLHKDLLRPRPETAELLDALNEGLNDIRHGIDRITNKPVDLTANDEIIDTIKSGLDSVRSDIETLRENNEVSLAAVPREAPMEKAMIPVDTAKQDDIKNLEVLITQLRIKVEAMEPDTEPVQRDDLARLEEMIRNVHQGVQDIGSREQTTSRDVGDDEAAAGGERASKDDVHAIETILRNTKDRLDDLIDGEQAVRKEHLDTVIDMLAGHKETVGSLGEKLDGTTRKEDIGALEELIAQVIIGIDELKETAVKDEGSEDKITKADIESVEARVLEMRGAIDSLSEMDFGAMPSKDDIAGLETLLRETKEQIEAHGDVASKSNDERQEEMLGLSERVTEVKTFLEELQDAVHVKLDDGSTGVEALGKLLEAMGEKLDKNETVGQDVKDMFETMKNEFEVSKEITAGSRLESEEKLQEAADGISAKLELKIAELVAKYDEFQASMDAKHKAGEERDLEMEAAVVSTKAVSEDLKLLIDTLGSTVTESLEKMEEASKTVFEKVEDLHSKSDETRAEGQTEHQLTREHITEAVTAVETLQGEIKDFQPQILDAVKDILLLVGEHFEHSKTSASDIQEKIVAKPVDQELLTAAPEKYDDAAVREQLSRLMDQKYDDSEVREKLDRIEQKYADNSIHEKLDKLADHSTTAAAAFAQLHNLEKVHQSVLETATQVSEMASKQNQRSVEESEDRERTLHDTEIALERKLAEKDHLEAAVLSLREEEERIRASVVNLRNEQESLIRQKTRLTGDVSSLETALRLRRDEFHDMESRAERLERRIVEGVMDHSRILLMGKSNGNKDNMNRKRVKKTSMAESDLAKSSPRPAVSMALSTRRSIAPNSQNGAPRRIASLSQMNSSMSRDAVKRSQSVRSPAGGGPPLRKRSWGGALSKSRPEDKENVNMTIEEDEESTPTSTSTPRSPATPLDLTRLSDIHSENMSLVDDDHDSVDRRRSDADTMRRASAGTTIISASEYTESDVGYDYDDATSVWTESVVGAESSIVGGGEEDSTILH